MTQSFDADPVRLSQKQARAIMERLGTPLANWWTLGKALLWLLMIAVAALLAFVCFVLWGVSQPTARTSLPDDISQVRLAYIGLSGARHKRVASDALLLTSEDAKAILSIANVALSRKNWHQVIKGSDTCELQIMFLDSNANVRHTLSVEQVGEGLFVHDNKWQQLLPTMDLIRFLAVVPQARLSAMRIEACGS